jgi:hypothetical protein
MQYDVWMVTPEVDDNFYRNSAAIASAGSLTLLATTPGINGYGFKVTFEANGDTSGVNFTIVGYQVGNTTGKTTTEIVTGPNTTSSSTNYYSGVVSISASGATFSGNISAPNIVTLVNGATGAVQYIVDFKRGWFLS